MVDTEEENGYGKKNSFLISTVFLLKTIKIPNDDLFSDKGNDIFKEMRDTSENRQITDFAYSNKFSTIEVF